MPKAPAKSRPARPQTQTIARNGKRVAATTAEVDVVVPTAPNRGKLPVEGDELTSKANSAGHQAHIHVGDCRTILAKLPEVKASALDLVFADPPFNWGRGYDRWNDEMAEQDYLEFTFDWLDLCVQGLRPGGALWVNIPDDWAAEICCYLKGREPHIGAGRAGRQPPTRMQLQNWCIWHYRFGQNATERFINSKVHAFYFIKPGAKHTWNPEQVLEMSDRAAIYGDPRTQTKKDGMPPGMRVPMDVWYGQFLGRVQGNNKERRHYHDNQLPEAYLERVIAATSKPGDRVLDPFLGSGTTGVMAHAMGRRFIGCEFSPVNASHALERINAGPVRPLGSTRGASSAIFRKRAGLTTPEEGVE